MRYSDARSGILTGDVLGICGNNTSAKIIRVAQRINGLDSFANITHCGVAWWIEGRLYCVEMDGKHNVLRPLSQHIYSGCAVNVYTCPVTINKMADQFDRATAAPIRYSKLDILKIGMRLIFGGHAKSNADQQMVCSTFVSQWLSKAGWVAPTGFVGMPSPAELCLALGAPYFKITRA